MQRERYPTLTLLTATFLFTVEITQMLTEVRFCINSEKVGFYKMMRGILAMAYDEGEMNIVHCSGAGQSWLH